MRIYCNDRTAVAQCVDDLLYNLNKDLRWTMTIIADRSVGCYAYIVTDVSLEDIEETQQQNYYLMHTNTSSQIIPDGSYLRK